MDNAEAAVEEFFGGEARATELRQMRQALHDRLTALVRERAAETDADRGKSLDAQIRTARRQVEALATEEVVAQFVEDSVRVAAAKSLDEAAEEQASIN